MRASLTPSEICSRYREAGLPEADSGDVEAWNFWCGDTIECVDPLPALRASPEAFGQFVNDLGCEPQEPYAMDNPEGIYAARCEDEFSAATEYFYYDCFIAEGKE